MTRAAPVPTTTNGSEVERTASRLPAGTPRSWAIVRPAVAVAMAGTMRRPGMTWAIAAQICGAATAAATPVARRSASMEAKDRASPVAAVVAQNAAIPARRTRRRSSRSDSGPATRAVRQYPIAYAETIQPARAGGTPKRADRAGSSGATRNVSVPTRSMTAKDSAGTRLIRAFPPGRSARAQGR